VPAKKKKRANYVSKAQPNKSTAIRLPKDALSSVDLGDAFAEHDKVLHKQPAVVFVRTPAIEVASTPSSSKCFFVGRRGTGKTAITFYLMTNQSRTTFQIHPQVFVPSGLADDVERLRDTRQRYFKSLVSCFKCAMQLEVARLWMQKYFLNPHKLGPALARQRNHIDDEDFDTRLLTFMDEIFTTLDRANDKQWVKQINRTKELANDMEKLVDKREVPRLTLLIDKIDEAWDGSDKAVVFLMGLMHACVELNATSAAVRPLLFLRENIFERVRLPIAHQSRSFGC
jgi:hypothetical protein